MDLSDRGSVSQIQIQTPNTDVPTLSLSDRLARLARLASKEESRLRFSDNDDDDDLETQTLRHCLDTMECLLDPRPGFSREISMCRPQSHQGTAVPIASQSPASRPTSADLAEANHAQLMDLHDQVTALNVELNERRKEAFDIYDLFRRRIEILSGKISEMQSDIHEL